ncbi:MAG: aminotransferase class V-fold PLP-dependent enzyme [Candidatus Omnitrophica bacterium]|nr:aminotransferase class V-fold PLP-dependent enzyme [Candidatus Omnitrophota bacterium]
MSDPAIHLDAPNIGRLEKERVCAAIDSGYVSTFGPLVGEFERQFAAVAGVSRAVATSSGTAALHVALHVLGVGPGDEVILPATTFAASLHAVMHAGACPVIVDVDPATWCLSPEAVKAAISPRTRAVMPVHLYGNVCDMPAIMAIAQAAGIYVVEDATEALGASIAGRQAGTFGDIGCYSFNGNKLITTGAGGMLVARSSAILDRVNYLINQANPREGMEGFLEVGFNYRMPNLNAALGMAQLERFSGFLKLKKEFHGIYRESLGAGASGRLQGVYPDADPSWWFTAAVFGSAAEALTVAGGLKARGIPSRKLFRPLHGFPYAGSFRRGSCAAAEMLYERGLCLPSSTLNSQADIAFVCKVIMEALAPKVEKC